MAHEFIQNFLMISRRVEELGENLKWPIPEGADSVRGDWSLTPGDTEIKAWQISRESAEMLRFLVLATKAKTILELGTSIGFSGMWLALAAKENGGHVYGTEIFPEKAQLAKEHIEEAGLMSEFTVLEENILDVLLGWDKRVPIDFVFMDADKQRQETYLEKLMPLMSEGGMIVVDNIGTHPQYTKPLLAKCAALGGLITRLVDIDHGLLLILKNNAALLDN